MTAAGLPHRITIQSLTEARNAAGQPIPTWATETTVWGRFDAQGAVETDGVGMQVRATVAGTVSVRRVDGLTEKKRLVVNGYGITDMTLNIVGVRPPDPMTGEIVMLVRRPDSVREPS